MECVPFEGELQGLQSARNIKRVLDSELYFYWQVFGFELADPESSGELKLFS